MMFGPSRPLNLRDHWEQRENIWAKTISEPCCTETYRSIIRFEYVKYTCSCLSVSNMAPIGRLYGDVRQFRTKVIGFRLVTISGLEFEQPPIEFGVTNESPQLTQKFPLGRIHGFEDNKGFELTKDGDRSLRLINLLSEISLAS